MPELIRTETGFGGARKMHTPAYTQGAVAARCRAWVEENFTVELMVRRYLEVYRQVIEKYN